jgi:hypothetical protein
MIVNKGIFLALFVLPLCLFSQYTEKIGSGRPGQANGPFGVGKNIYQVQTGFRLSEVDSEYFIFKLNTEIIDNSTMFRIGLFERTELRAGIDYNIRDKFREENTVLQSQSRTSNREERVLNGVSNMSLGIRQNLTQQKKALPAIGIQATALLGGLNDYKTDVVAVQFRLLLQHKITKNLLLNTNLTTATETENLSYTFSLNYLITPSIRLVGEMYGVAYFNEVNLEKDVTNNFDFGIGYWISDNLQVDLFGGFGYNGSTFRSKFISTGLSYRINRRN